MAAGGSSSLYALSGSSGPSDRSRRLTMQQLLGDYVKSSLSIARQGEPSVLVVDAAALSVVNACVSMSDLVAIGFRSVVTLETWKEHSKGIRRPSLFPVPAVYYVRATPKNLAMILDDFATPDMEELLAPEDFLERCFPCILGGIAAPENNPTYGSCRLLFIPGMLKHSFAGPLSNSAAAVERLLTEANSVERYKRLKDYLKVPDPENPPECLLEALPEEESFFNLRMPDLISIMYSSNRRRDSGYKETIKLQLRQVAYRLLTLCVGLNESPEIRYRDTPASRLRGITGHSMSQLTAMYLRGFLEQYKESHPEWRPIQATKREKRVKSRRQTVELAKELDSVMSASAMQASEPSGPAIFLICERLDDVMGALAHDWIYQNAISDVLGYTTGEPFPVYAPKKPGEPRRLIKKVLLDRSDFVWSKIRFLDMTDAEVMVTAGRMETMRKDKEVDAMRAAGDLKGLHALARLQQSGGKVWDARYIIHQRFVEDFVDAVRREGGGGNLYRVAALEQLLVSGVYHDGSAWSKSRVSSELKTLLRSPELTSEEKARLLILWLLRADAVTFEERRELTQMANLDREHMYAVHSLPNCGIPLDRQTPVERGVCRDMTPKEAREAAKERNATDCQGYIYADPLVVATAGAAADEAVGRPATMTEWVSMGLPDGSKAGGGGGGGLDEVSEDEEEDEGYGGKIGGREDKYAAAAAGLGSVRRKRAAEKAKEELSAPIEDDKAFDERAKKLMPLSHTTEPRANVRGRRVIVFVIGGMTPAEQARLERLGQQRNVEIIAGSTSLTPPRDFLRQLAKTDTGFDEVPEGVSPAAGAVDASQVKPRTRADSDE